MESFFHKKLKYILKHNVVVLLIYRFVMSAIFRFIGFFVRTDEKLVLLSSYGGDRYNDSPKVLFESMKKDARFADFKYVWAFVDPSSFEIDGAEKVKIDSIQYFITALKAKIWITNVNIERGLRFKKKNTIYLNTGHGTGPKKGGNAVKGRIDYDFSNVDILCCDGEYLRNALVTYYKANESSLLWCGRPREDELFDFSDKDKWRIRQDLNIQKDKKIILYMPTWRDYKHSLPSFQLWHEMLGNEYVVLCRLHHFSDIQRIDEFKNFLIDVTNYDDVNELYFASDILVSDYSSAFFDFGLLEKPFFCFADDYQQFCCTYGLFIDIKKEFPHGVFKDDQTLLSMIKNMNYEKECLITKEYIKKYVSHEKNATECCINRLSELLNNR